jgi:hypothetical protein
MLLTSLTDKSYRQVLQTSRTDKSYIQTSLTCRQVLHADKSYMQTSLTYRQVLHTSTDPSQPFSAPFKAGSSRQVHTCYKPQNATQRKLTFSSSYRYRRNGSSLDLEPQSIDIMTLATWACSHFHLTYSTSFGI